MPQTLERTIPFGRPVVGEEEMAAVQEVLRGPILTHGPLVKRFEAEFAQYTGATYAVAVNSCTAGLHLAYLALGVGPGDEVLVPAQTHVATAHAVELCGGKPVFVDVERRTGNIDLEQAEKAVTSRTRGMAVVHYLGLPVDMDRTLKLAQRHKLFVVEDCALGIGSYFAGKHVGLFGDVGCFSFYPVKHITTGEGGMVISNRRELATTIAKQRAFGIDRNVVHERQIPGVYDVEMLGLNYRLNEIGAAMGLEQLKRLPGFLQTRQDNYEALTAQLRGLSGISILESTAGKFQSSYYCHSLILEERLATRRFDLVSYLTQCGIGTSVYYPHAVPTLKYYTEKYGHQAVDYPQAVRIAQQSIALPVGPHLNTDDMMYIGRCLKEGLRKVSQ